MHQDCTFFSLFLLLFAFPHCFQITAHESIIVDSTLQTFPPPEAQGKISGVSRPPRDADGKCNLNLLCLNYLILFQLWKWEC